MKTKKKKTNLGVHDKNIYFRARSVNRSIYPETSKSAKSTITK